MNIRDARIRKVATIFLFVVGQALLAALLYFLLPVSVQTLFSADHVRWVYGSGDISPVVSGSLSSVWELLLKLMHATGLGVGTETFATAAALSGWVVWLAIIVLSFYAPWPAVILVALSPAVLWTSVIPNGAAVSLLVLALMGWLCTPSLTPETNRAKWTLGALVEGLGCALTVVAWPLALGRAVIASHEVRNGRISKNARLLRGALFLAGFSLPMSLGVLLGALQSSSAPSNFSMLPVLASFNALFTDDILSAGRVLIGTGGETAIGMIAAFSFLCAASMSWNAEYNPRKRWQSWIGLALPFIAFFVFGHPSAWRMAHPGWNTILEDSAQNMNRSVSKLTIAIVPSLTEEAAVRYVQSVLLSTGTKPSAKVVVFTPTDLFKPGTVERIQKREDKFSATEFETALKSGISADPKKQFVENLMAPNIARGVQFWIEFPPDHGDGFENRFLASGLQVSGTTGPTKFLTDRNVMRDSFVRAQPTLIEYLAGPSIETAVFARYAVFHFAVAHIIEREQSTADWKRRARGEYYAALRKVQWSKEAYEKVCAEPAREGAATGTNGTKTEPLDACKDVDWYYQR